MLGLPRQCSTSSLIRCFFSFQVDLYQGEDHLNEHDDLRVVVLVRNMNAREFVLFEDEVRSYIPDNYKWIVNKRSNLEGYNRQTGERLFTWQPHGAQFTIHRKVPTATSKFRIAPNVPIIEAEYILRLAKYEACQV